MTRNTFILVGILINLPSFSQSIYNGGSEDGYSNDCYAQADNMTSAISIYSGGNGDGYSAFCLGEGLNAEVPLPIELISFQAYAEGYWINLKWQTASEIKNDYFSVERSKYGLNWNEIIVVEGADNSSSILNYREIDLKPLKGISYYRLKQTDLDGEFSYSKIKSVDLKDELFSSIKVYPNPTQHQVIMEGSLYELEQLNIFNIMGIDVTAQTKITMRNERKKHIWISNLNAGIYFIKTKTMIYKLQVLNQ